MWLQQFFLDENKHLHQLDHGCVKYTGLKQIYAENLA